MALEKKDTGDDVKIVTVLWLEWVQGYEILYLYNVAKKLLHMHNID